MGNKRSYSRREKKKAKRDIESRYKESLRHTAHRFDKYKPLAHQVELTDIFLDNIITANAMMCFSVGSQLHNAMRSFSKRDIRKIWEKQHRKCAVSGVDLYRTPQAGPGGIGIDRIDFKRKMSLCNIRLVSSSIAYTRIVKKIRRLTFHKQLPKEWSEANPVYDALLCGVYSEMRGRSVKGFKSFPIRAEFKTHGNKGNSIEFIMFHGLQGACRQSTFACFHFVDDYLLCVDPLRNTTSQVPLATPNLDLASTIIKIAKEFYALHAHKLLTGLHREMNSAMVERVL